MTAAKLYYNVGLAIIVGKLGHVSASSYGYLILISM
jgi:hypothetical protein